MRVRNGLFLLSAAVVAAGALGGWRVSVRFVGADTRPADGPAIVVKLPEASALPDAAGRLRPAAPRVGTRSAPAGEATKRAGATRAPVAVAVRRFAGLHITFPRTWRPVTYAIHSPQKPPVRFPCAACAAAPSAANGPFVTLFEWDP